ncbi:tRNA pseudouridine(13) synthase TruD [Paraglaciecola aquimarina]|uniref:tRNA pseudouridine synthase D n=1 Tax=Paraglaciecola algarum TaxID=3050085 RepID=A0ABS9DBV8_9ALTE|nr:tRNA pseudouridine(13) synthase TruD [Paraglaciecola sp. G1-23]MCF2950450.1 tRNA pseudouridine(13) synthase TruD [Paraglaciecola sp. G1-23]
MLSTKHWLRQYPSLGISGQLKTSAEDFQVTETLGYEPTGEGEHIYLWVEKIGLNTAYLAEQIAKFTKLPLRNVTYAGRKDKHALTNQWFSVHLPGKGEFDWNTFEEPGAKVLHAVRHNKKLRTGVLKGNYFNITLRNLTSVKNIEQRLQIIASQGVPNYYGAQRFGDTRYDDRGGNLVLAEKMINGESIRNRNKRSMAISALRSWFFNENIHTRLKQDNLTNALAGDVMQLAGSNSFFCAIHIDEDTINRLDERDIYTTGPLWGIGELASQLVTLQQENSTAEQNSSITQLLESLGLKQERRALRLFPQQMSWTLKNSDLNLQFSLPAGCFATSVIREIIDVNQEILEHP